MSVAMPKFALGQQKMSEEEYNKLQEEANKTKGFGQGYHQVEVRNAKYHVGRDTGTIFCKGDSTWVNVSFDLVGADGRTKKHYLQIPTQSIQYVKDGKASLFNYNKLVEFLSALGEDVTFENHAEIIGKYFSSEDALSKLEGREVGVTIGFNGPYVKFVSKGIFRIVIEGKEYAEAGKVVEFPNADAAIAFGVTQLKKNLQQWPEVQRFQPIVGKEKSEQPSDNGDNW